MAVRLRFRNGEWIALCAAEHKAELFDIYIDDSQDHALRIKYISDYKLEGLIKEADNG